MQFQTEKRSLWEKFKRMCLLSIFFNGVRSKNQWILPEVEYSYAFNFFDN